MKETDKHEATQYAVEYYRNRLKNGDDFFYDTSNGAPQGDIITAFYDGFLKCREIDQRANDISNIQENV